MRKTMRIDSGRRVAKVELIVMMFMLSCSGGDTTNPPVTYRGESSDPAGDGGVADLVFASLEVRGTRLVARAQTTQTTFAPDSLLITFNLDTDESTATGYTTTNPGHAGLGIDCIIELGKTSADLRGARVQRWQGASFVTTASAEVTLLSNGYEASVPLARATTTGRRCCEWTAFASWTPWPTPRGKTGYRIRPLLRSRCGDWSRFPGLRRLA